MAPPPICVLTGCTACGKTALSLEWAERFEAEIVSCDSLLFYRGMDIGTAKPTVLERARVPHHLIDILEPTDRMDVKAYVALARAAVVEIEARGRRVLVVGGSGFYLRSFLAPVADDVPVDLSLRTQLEAQLRSEGLEALVGRLRRLNPAGLGALDVRNPRRVIRALERCQVSGRTLSELGERFRAAPWPFARREVRLVEVTREPQVLRERIEARARAMIGAGLVDEVRALRARGFEGNPTTAKAVGYREVLAWLDEGGSEENLVESIVAGTRRLARKQRTWFRSQLPPHRVVDLGREAVVPTAEWFDG